VRKTLARQYLAQAMDGFRVAGEIRKWHDSESTTETRRKSVLALSSWLLANGQKLRAKSGFLRVSVPPW
jgi:hypothetical protein